MAKNAGGIVLEEITYGQLNNLQENNTNASGDRRRTDPVTALRTAVEKAFSRDTLQGISEFYGIVVGRRTLTTAIYDYRPTVLNSFSTITPEAASEGAEAEVQNANINQYLYKVYIPELQPLCPPTSFADPIIFNYPDVGVDLPQGGKEDIGLGAFVTVRYEDPGNLFGPKIVMVSDEVLRIKNLSIDAIDGRIKFKEGISSVIGSGLPGSRSVPAFTYNELKIFRTALQPLLEYIALRESGGSYNAVNRGRGGDTPGGAKALVGKDLTEMTIEQVFSYMKGGSKAADTGVGGATDDYPNGTVGFLATGKYQMIPDTLRAAVSSTDIPLDTVYNIETQETLGVYLLLKKREKLGSYLLGSNNDEREAAQQAALEWASLPLQYERSNGCQRGFSAYCKGGANPSTKVSRTPEDVMQKLRTARQSVSSDSSAKNLITRKGIPLE